MRMIVGTRGSRRVLVVGMVSIGIVVAAAACRPAGGGSSATSSTVGSATSTSESGSTSTFLQQVSFSDPQHGYGLFEEQGSNGCSDAVGHTNDGGATFSSLVPVTSGSCARNISFSGPEDGFVYGPDLYVTYDGGTSWAKVAEAGPVLAVAPLGSSVWMVTAACPAGSSSSTCPLQLSQSTDGGRTWHASPTPPPVATWSAATGGDLGQSWLIRTTATQAYVVGVSLPGGANTVPIARTDDGGATWVTEQIPCNLPALSVVVSAFPGGGLAALCAGQPSAGFQPKSLSLSTDGGGSWVVRGPCSSQSNCSASPLTNGYVSSVGLSAGSATDIFDIGGRGPLVETTDGGQTWVAGAPGAANDTAGAAQVVFFDPHDGLVLGDQNTASAPVTIWHTTDAGRSWTSVVPRVVGS